jgi:hypothetical protein
MTEEMNVNMFAPDELVFLGIGAPTGFAAARAVLLLGLLLLGMVYLLVLVWLLGMQLGLLVLHKGLL